MKLTSTRQEYVFTNPSGYCFTVTAEHNPETGWTARVAIASHGYKTADDAIKQLVRASKEFTRQAEASP